MSSRSGILGRTALAVFLTLPFLYPFFFLLSTAIRPQEDYVRDRLGLPLNVTSEHLAKAWNTVDLGRATLNSLTAVGVAVVVLVIVSSSAAYWFLNHQNRWTTLLLAGIGALWVIPFVVYVIPLFVLMSDLRLINNLVVLGFMYAATNLPFGIYFMYAYYRIGIPDEVIQAARVDGATQVQEFFRIILPLSVPALGTLLALGFVWSWGDLVLSLVMMQDSEKYTLTVAAAQLVTRFNPAVQETAAAAIIALVPVAIVFLLMQRAILRGVTAGVGK